jgi:hypothetical protein
LVHHLFNYLNPPEGKSAPNYAKPGHRVTNWQRDAESSLIITPCPGDVC